MRKPQPKKHFQIQRMFGLAKPKAELAGLDTKEYLEDLAGKRLSELTFDEANIQIEKLGGTAFRAYGNSKRNENHKKQEAGVKSIETVSHIEFIRKLAEKRGIGESGLESLASRMRLPWPTQTTEQGNKIAEAIKSMIKRDAEKAAQSEAVVAEPAFRRVA